MFSCYSINNQTFHSCCIFRMQPFSAKESFIMLRLVYMLTVEDDLIHCIESIVFAYREDLHQSEMIGKGLCAGLKDAERMISLTEEKCAATTKRILEMTELEKTEKEQVTGAVHAFIPEVQQRDVSALNRISPINTSF